MYSFIQGFNYTILSIRDDVLQKRQTFSMKLYSLYFDTITQESGIFISHKTIVETVVQRMSRLA